MLGGGGAVQKGSFMLQVARRGRGMSMSTLDARWARKEKRVCWGVGAKYLKAKGPRQPWVNTALLMKHVPRRRAFSRLFPNSLNRCFKQCHDFSRSCKTSFKRLTGWRGQTSSSLLLWADSHGQDLGGGGLQKHSCSPFYCCSKQLTDYYSHFCMKMYETVPTPL